MRSGLALLALATWMAGCSTPYRDVTETKPRPTANAQHQVGTFEGEHGTKLFWQSWQPNTETRAALVIMHGLKDHSSRYDGFARELAARGIAVYAFDLRGHGRSAGNRVAVDKFEDWVADLDRFIGRVRETHQGPVFLFGHSLGGLIAAGYVATRDDDQLAGLILSGPALALDIWPITVALTRFTGNAFGSLPALKLPNENFSSDPDTVAAMGKDPLVYQDAGPAHTAAELARGVEIVWAQIAQFKLPMLLLHGDQDKLTEPKGSKQLEATAPSTDKTLKIYEGFWHDLLHEPGRERIAGDITAWIDQHLTAQ